MKPKPSENFKAWALHLRNLVGGEVAVKAYSDESEERSVQIFRSINNEGILCATIGLMEINQSQNPDIPINSEVILDKRGQNEKVANVLSTIAFYIIKNEWRISPGVVFKDIMTTYFPEANLPHIYFTAPFQWSTLSRVDLPDGVIYPLVAIPISEKERKIAREKSGQILEEIWTNKRIDLLDWDRESVV